MRDRSYHQYCGLARALDVIGERWNLLIVRELLIRPMRYGELRAGLPEIATNLLADRLRALEAASVVERRVGERGGIVYALTEWGEQLRDAVAALLRWSTPLMVDGRRGDAFEPRWLTISLTALLADRTASPAVEVALEVEGTTLAVRIDGRGPRVELVRDEPPDRARRAAPRSVVARGAPKRSEAEVAVAPADPEVAVAPAAVAPADPEVAVAPAAPEPAVARSDPEMTVVSADPETVLGLAAGVISVEEVIAGGGVRGDPRPLRAIFSSPS